MLESSWDGDHWDKAIFDNDVYCLCNLQRQLFVIFLPVAVRRRSERIVYDDELVPPWYSSDLAVGHL